MKTLLRRLLFVFLGLISLVVLFYAEEDWRGKRAWENCKANSKPKAWCWIGRSYIPPPVPDDQNFFKAPKMTDWFVKRATQHGIANSPAKCKYDQNDDDRNGGA